MERTGVLGAIGGTHLVDLGRLRPKGAGRILVKLEGGNPTGSMKDRMALAMIEAAERDGRLRPGQRVVEFTGGSTGSSLALVCAAKGYPLTLVTADCFAEEKTLTSRALGATVEVLETPEGKVYPGLVDRMRARAREIREAEGAFWTDQMTNEAQLEGYGPMGEEILAGCPGLTDFVMAVGTAGCAMGNARVLRARKPGVRITLVEPAESPYLSRGQAGKHRVEGIAVLPRPPLLRDDLYDAVVAVPEEEGRATARRLAAEEGLFVGTSSGLNVAAAMGVARERGPEAVVVTVGVDSGLKYLRGDLFAPAARTVTAR